MMELKAVNLCKAYGGRQILRDMSFTAGPGITCLTAPSGAGKSTLLHIFLGLVKPDSGRVETPSRWGAVFQEPRLLEHLDAAGNLRFVLGRELGGAEEMLARLGLELPDSRPVREYSGGMKRRLALARALLVPSEALALDEPFAGLDRENHARSLACVREAAKTKPVLLATHDPADTTGLPCISFGKET